MKLQRTLPILALLAIIPFTRADELRLKDGSIIKGKILGLEAGENGKPGLFTVQANGIKDPVKVNQADVATFSTDSDFFIATAGQTEAKGRVESTSDGVKVVSADGTVTSKVDNIRDGWVPGSPSPADKVRVKLERHWEYTADIGITGTTGNSQAFSEMMDFAALNKGPDDDLKFYISQAYSKAEASGSAWATSANNLHAGLLYNNYFARPYYWYLRSDNGFDRVQDISFFSTDAGGLGYLFFDQDDEHMGVRAGVSYRFAAYHLSSAPNVNSPGLDFGFHNDTKFKNFTMVNDLTFTPAFNNFSVFIATQDSHIDIPLADDAGWKFRIGIANQYNAAPPPRIKNLDTTYYMKLVLNWK